MVIKYIIIIIEILFYNNNNNHKMDIGFSFKTTECSYKLHGNIMTIHFKNGAKLISKYSNNSIEYPAIYYDRYGVSTQLYTLNDIFHYSRPPVIGGERTDGHKH